MLIRTSATKVAGTIYEARALGKSDGVETSYAGDCVDPVYVYLAGLPDPVLAQLDIKQLGRTSQHMYLRCRRCSKCLRQRSRVWTARAIVETTASNRTWFGTLTLAPDRATQARYAADRRLTQRISDRSSSANQFTEMVNHVTPELTRFLKRIRKNSGASLRYLLVAEAHKSGVPHWHCLIHEYQGKATKRELDAAWRYGFSQFRLVETGSERVVRYACKYLSKTAMTRVRASRGYGSALPDHITERILSATQAIREAASNRLGQTSLSKEGPPAGTARGFDTQA